MKASFRSVSARACLFFLLGSACLAPHPSRATTLTIGVSDMGPLLSAAPNGQPDGVLGNLLSEIARREGWTLKTELCEWQDCLRRLREGKLDLLPAVSLTSDRAAFFDFHQTPVLQTWTRIYVRKGEDIHAIQDLNGLRLAALAGSVEYGYLETMLPGLGVRPRLVPVDSLIQGFQLAQAGRADAVASDFFYGNATAAQYGLAATPIILLPSGIYYAAPKGRNADVLRAIERHLGAWKADSDSVYYRILTRWDNAKMRPADAAAQPGYGPEVLAAAVLAALAALAYAAYVRCRARREGRRLRTAGHRLAVVLDHIDDLICIEDGDRRCRYANRPFREFSGLPAAPPAAALDPRQAPGPVRADGIAAADLAALKRGETLVAQERRPSARTGRVHTFRSVKMPLYDPAGATDMYCTILTDITARMRAEELARHNAFHDPLTGLPNRILLLDRLERTLLDARLEGGCGAVLVLDLDGFKKLNDSRSHAIGDQVLKEVARRLMEHTLEQDTVSRISGDEFMVLLTRLDADPDAGARQALKIAERLRRVLASTPLEPGEQACVFTASIGLTLLHAGGASAGDAIREADLAMQRAKQLGGNRTVFYDHTLQTEFEQRLWMEKDLTLALNTSQLAMHIQPQYARDGRVTGAELLARWTHPEHGPVSPGLFVPLAEESSLINHLTYWSLDVACRALLNLQDLDEIYPVSVNISPKVLMDPGFGEAVRGLLKRTGAPGNRMIFEITEGVWIQDVEATARRMRELNRLGIRFSIDDFGTGYSNLSCLMRLPIFELKIDQSLIRNLPDDPDSIAIARLILAMAGQLDFWVVAEGVEDEPQAAFLAQHGCDAMQGYLLARPMPIDAWISIVRLRRGRLR
ncbi:diguanylate cyclase / phosphodiesterase [Castellaniella defragrans 65Phen]|uniref:Diguanylate cyclase / phosphodiesterase n=1 Tax=Castellaniella defragrans (strain DSM 12143 / CCUG 39792 / 65Phen) TaxID=1437824 RepID=W8WTV6_CASD6|nr:EAL domain-containing protein [Castellaniella defragrans]CDM22969.1 diguanylate cyclase / phosphodiesterase [Castellaniella defragrans 65Phen]